MLRELQAIENKIIIGRNDEAMDQLERLLDNDPNNFRALELFCQVSVATGSARRLLSLVIRHLEAIQNTNNASTLLTISEALLTVEDDQEAYRIAATLNAMASNRHLETTEIRRAVINLRKLKEDDKALELVEKMFIKEPSLKRNASLLQLAGKAQIELAKKCIEKARDRDTPKDMKFRAWDLCRKYLSDADRSLHSALEFANDFEREYLERDLEFLIHMQQISQKPTHTSSSRTGEASIGNRLSKRFKVNRPQ